MVGVVTIHDLIFERFPALYGAVDRRIYHWKFRSAAARARLVVAISQQTGRDLHELYGIPWSRIRVVYQGCHAAFRRRSRRSGWTLVARRHGLAPGFVLQVGTIEERKNLLLTVSAVAALPGVTLVAVGRPTAYARRVREAIRSLGVESRVRLLVRGRHRGPGGALPAGSAGGVPVRFEGFGLPVVEALASGTPVVTTRGGVFPEAGGPGSAYVDPFNAEELRSTLAALLADPDRRVAMRAAGLSYAERFRDERIAADLLDVYAEACRGPSTAQVGAVAGRAVKS